MKHFADRVAVITGAASGNDVLAMVCDVCKASHVEELAEAALIRLHAIHLLFNNAGVFAGGLVWENSEADWDWVLGVNLRGAIHGIRVFTPPMLACAKREAWYEGHIVNTASMAGLLATPALGAYNVSKHALVALAETLYHDLKLIDAPIGASVLCHHFVPTAIGRLERHRPAALHNVAAPTASQDAARILRAQAVAACTISTAEVAHLAFEAIGRGDLYIFRSRRPCPQWRIGWTRCCTAARRPMRWRRYRRSGRACAPRWRSVDD